MSRRRKPIYNQGAGLVASGAAEETYAYFSAIQMASYGLDYPIIVGGHNVAPDGRARSGRRFRGHDADDLLLTLNYRAAGWGGVYVPRILARGLTPVDWRGYLIQQQRWARSVIDLKLRPGPRTLPPCRSISRIMSYLHGSQFPASQRQPYLAIVCTVLYLLATAPDARGALRSR